MISFLIRYKIYTKIWMKDEITKIFVFQSYDGKIYSTNKAFENNNRIEKVFQCEILASLIWI